jgi:chromosome segregation ATPase
MPESHPDDLTMSDSISVGAAGPRTQDPLAVSDQQARALITNPFGESDALKILLQASAAAESLQQRFSELQQHRAEIAADQKQLEADRKAFEERAQEFASQVARDRGQQRELMADLEQRINRVTQQEELLQRQAAELRSAQRALAEERVILKQSVRAELDEDRMKLSQERAVLDAERERVRLQADQDRRDFADRLKSYEQELKAEKVRLAERAREDLAAEIVMLNRQREEWQQVHEAQLQEIRQQADDLQQQRELFGQQVEEEQQRLRDEIEKKRQALLTDQNNLQRRYRFQFEHLTRAKDDLEAELREFRREQQLFRSERLKFLEQHRLRFRQLEHVRQLLTERDASLIREQRILDRSRTAALSDIQRQQRRAEEERDAILRDIESRQRRVRQQEAGMTELAAKLEDRSQRLNRLRAELDQTQAEILEQRLAIEEARSQLVSDHISPEMVRARLEQVRGDVQSFFEKLRSQVHADRDKIEAAAVDVSERQQQFRRDRVELEQWFAAREEELSVRLAGSIVDEQQATISSLLADITELQNRWQNERTEAERTIRNLLEQLTARDVKAMESSSGAPIARDAA